MPFLNLVFVSVFNGAEVRVAEVAENGGERGREEEGEREGWREAGGVCGEFGDCGWGELFFY